MNPVRLHYFVSKGKQCVTWYLFVNGPELQGPACVVEERSEVKAVVIRTVALSMV